DIAIVVSFEAALLAYASREHADLLKEIDQSGDYNGEIEAKLKALLESFKATQSW
ncbi:F0F1 ATP synthase subunit alpha, partial [Enterobacter hormaechei]|nr:F0F1 ATP synthase subunit alpha [Enterobacter hormaechei]